MRPIALTVMFCGIGLGPITAFVGCLVHRASKGMTGYSRKREHWAVGLLLMGWLLLMIGIILPAIIDRVILK